MGAKSLENPKKPNENREKNRTYRNLPKITENQRKSPKITETKLRGTEKEQKDQYGTEEYQMTRCAEFDGAEYLI